MKIWGELSRAPANIATDTMRARAKNRERERLRGQNDWRRKTHSHNRLIIMLRTTTANLSLKMAFNQGSFHKLTWSWQKFNSNIKSAQGQRFRSIIVTIALQTKNTSVLCWNYAYTNTTYMHWSNNNNNKKQIWTWKWHNKCIIFFRPLFRSCKRIDGWPVSINLY